MWKMHVSLVVAPVFALAGCGHEDTTGGGSSSAQALFSEVTGEWGIPSPAGSWPDGKYQIPEISVGGVALFDCDGDEDLDIYQVCHPPPDAPRAPAPNRLFRQERPGKFVEVAGAGGLNDPGYGSGVAVGDVDNDGDVDVYVTNVEADALYLNAGNGTFTNATASAGIRGAQWSSCAAFLDYDRDGQLDLYVSHYLVDDPTRICRLSRTAPRDYCGPSRFRGVRDTLYRNMGDGRFVDVSAAAGIRQALPGFGVVCFDLTGDGWVDIYVANDKKPNQLYVNRRNGTFVDEATERGAAVNGNAVSEASMGVTLGDVNSDGSLDLFLTHLVDETHTLYLGGVGASVRFEDSSARAGMAVTLPFTGWGCGFADFDHDGDLDLAVANGRIARGKVLPGAEAGEFWDDYAEPNHLFLNDGRGRFRASSRGGEFTSTVEPSRGLALGDLDGDGDTDLVAVDVGRGLRVFRNDAPATASHWLRVRALIGKRDALGALVRVEAGGTRQIRPLLTSYSFASANEAVVHFGLGSASRVERLEVVWPDGTTERFAVAGVDRGVTVRQGEGMTE